MVSEVIIGMFDKFSLVKIDSKGLFYIILSFAQLFISPFIVRDDIYTRMILFIQD